MDPSALLGQRVGDAVVVGVEQSVTREASDRRQTGERRFSIVVQEPSGRLRWMRPSDAAWLQWLQVSA